MFGSATLDVLIGLIFIYFVLSVACSAMVETITSFFATRARLLHDAIVGLLSEAGTASKATDFFIHPLIAASVSGRRSRCWILTKFRKFRKGRGEGVPSYISSSSFATAVLDNLGKGTKAIPSIDRQRFWALRDALTPEKGKESKGLKQVLANFAARSVAEISDLSPNADEARLANFRKQIEDWYNTTMERAGGWYKRHVQLLLLVIALVLVGFGNIDTIAIVQRLYTDKDTRNALVSAATQAAAEDAATASAPAATGTAPAGTNSVKDLSGTRSNQDKLHERVAELDRLSIPVGWRTDELPHGLEWIGKIIGLLLTILAISLGAPFWFDMLSKLVNLRNNGGKPSTKDDPPASAAPIPAQPAVISPAITPIMDTGAAPGRLPSGYWARPERIRDWEGFVDAAKVPAQAAALARMALLTYESEFVVKAFLSQQWKRQEADAGSPGTFMTFLEPGGTQAVIVAWDTFIVVAFRGTQSTELSDVLDDAICLQVQRSEFSPGKIHTGFASALIQRMADLDAYLDRLLQQSPRPVFITGHSLGAALATLYAAHRTLGKPPTAPAPVYLTTFGSPRVGDGTFASTLEAELEFDREAYCEKVDTGTMNLASFATESTRVVRFVDHNDLVTRVPPRSNEFDHVGPTLYLRDNGTIDLSMTEWRRFLNSVTDAVTQFRNFTKSSLTDHSMERYLMVLDNLANSRQ